jgi:hypothetical protein
MTKPGKQWNASGSLALLQLLLEKAHAQIIQDCSCLRHCAAWLIHQNYSNQLLEPLAAKTTAPMSGEAAWARSGLPLEIRIFWALWWPPRPVIRGGKSIPLAVVEL